MQVENHTLRADNAESAEESPLGVATIWNNLQSTLQKVVNSMGSDSNCSSSGFYLEKLSISAVISKGMGYVATLLAMLVTYIGVDAECPCGSYFFLIAWQILFSVTRTNPKNCPSLNLFLFIWGHILLVAGKHSSYITTLSIIFILLTNLEFYIVLSLVIVMLSLAIVVFLMTAFKNLSRERPEVRMRLERQITIDNLKRSREIDQTQVCSVCFEPELDCKLKCGHHFHFNCVRNWIRIKVSCPICRSEVL